MSYTQKLLVYTFAAVLVSSAYSVYVLAVQSVGPHQETWLSEVGEVFGELGIWMFAVIYGRTLLKLSLGKGSPLQRVLPDFSLAPTMSWLKKGLVYLNRTHNYVGIATICTIGIHLVLVGFPMEILFFPLVVALVVWQGMFGLFLTLRYSPKELKKFSYLVHAQLFTGVLIGVFTWFGHLLID
ncbi:MAG: hypothetical protein V7731_22025 [Amphritea sp.]